MLPAEEREEDELLSVLEDLQRVEAQAWGRLGLGNGRSRTPGEHLGEVVPLRKAMPVTVDKRKLSGDLFLPAARRPSHGATDCTGGPPTQRTCIAP